MKPVALRMTGSQHELLRQHLFPGDGKEAVAIALCGRRRGEKRHVLCVHRVHPIPHDQCRVREHDFVAWRTDSVAPLLEDAAATGLAVLKLHSHPGGWDQFSPTDDTSDADFFSSVFGWMASDDPHASAIMLPNGRVFGRSIDACGGFAPLSLVQVAGDDIKIWRDRTPGGPAPGFAERHAQMFGEATIDQLQQISVAVVGCSGTGSPVIEMLARLGVGRLVLVDSDHVEERNLNRILNATREDAALGRLKVDVLARAVARMGLGTSVERLPVNLASPNAVRAVGDCDIVFGCMDGAFGRNLLNRLATFYNLPYFDLGVALEADGRGGICEAMGAVHYIQPDRSSLRDRRVYTPEQVRAEGLRLTNPEEYQRRVRERYIAGVNEDRPAVISINMQIASLAINELLARLHPYRTCDNSECAAVRYSFFHGEQYCERDGRPVPASAKLAGKGDVVPLLDFSMLSEGSARD